MNEAQIQRLKSNACAVLHGADAEGWNEADATRSLANQALEAVKGLREHQTKIEQLQAELGRAASLAFVLMQHVPDDLLVGGLRIEAERYRAEVGQLRAEKEALAATVHKLRTACESALAYFKAMWAETDHHPHSHYADFVDELTEAIGK